jgi:hypothetical protein
MSAVPDALDVASPQLVMKAQKGGFGGEGDGIVRKWKHPPLRVLLYDSQL